MKKTITEHMKLTKSQRQSHTNKSSACIPVVNRYNTKHAKKDEYSLAIIGGQIAKQTLILYHCLEKFNGNTEKVYTCHLCKNDSTAPNGFVCKNPEHLYFGTPTENHYDKTPNARAKGGTVGAKVALTKGNHSCQQKRTCIYCGFESTPGMIGRWHNERCKHKP